MAFHCFVIANDMVLAGLLNTHVNLKFKTVSGQKTSEVSLLPALCHLDRTEPFQNRNAGKNNLIFWHYFPLK